MLNHVHEQKIDELFEQFTAPGSPGCALGVLVDGKLVYEKGFGLANLEYDVPITPSSVFHVASMSKQFTALAALLMEDSGMISLDDPISRYLPRCPEYAEAVTIRHLIHHTSGLRSDLVLLLLAGWRLEDVITNEDVMELFRSQRRLNFQPGEKFSYSGTGYLVLAAIIEQVSGQSLDAYCRQMIFEPLGMKQTFFNDDILRVVKDRAYAYYDDGESGYQKAVLSCGLTGGTGLFTSIRDLKRWDENFYTGKVGGLPLVNQMSQRAQLSSGEEIDYGCGLFLMRYAGREVVAHGGDGAGIHCYMMRIPDEHFSVAVLGNLGSIQARQLAQKTADLYFDDRPDESANQEELLSSVALDEEQLLEKVGRYFDEDSATFVDVEIEEGGLKIWGYAVLPQSENAFIFAVSPEARAEFSLAAKGEGRELTIDTGLSRQKFAAVDRIDPTRDYLSDFEGIFYSRELDVTWRIFLEGDDLMVQRRRQGQSRLNPVTRDVFSDDWMASLTHSGGKPATMVFERDHNQSPSGFRVSDSGARVKNLSFTKSDS
jgi:CubicO group peptidase (beta-lactamase class C family)